MKKLILFELRKVFSKRLSLIALVGILLFSVLISFSTYQNKYAFDGVSAEGSGKTAVEIDKGIAAKYEGILTDEKVQQMMNDFAPTHGKSVIVRYTGNCSSRPASGLGHGFCEPSDFTSVYQSKLDMELLFRIWQNILPALSQVNTITYW